VRPTNNATYENNSRGKIDCIWQHKDSKPEIGVNIQVQVENIK
jgi:hypothetical protein